MTYQMLYKGINVLRFLQWKKMLMLKNQKTSQQQKDILEPVFWNHLQAVGRVHF